MTLLLDLPGTTEWILIFICLGLVLIPAIFYVITLQSTFNTISSENRKMSSSNVWLLLIPVFGVVWHFIVVDNLAKSIDAEAKSKDIKIAEPKPAYNIGLAMCILTCLFFIPGLNFFASTAALICWILYWVKITWYKNILIAGKIAVVSD